MDKKTDAERTKEWRKKNPEKIKAYLERSKEHRRKVAKEYNEKNKDNLSKYYYENKKDILKRHSLYHKSEKGKSVLNKANKKYAKDNPVLQSKMKKRRATREKYGKLKNGFEYHHNTKPYHVDKFNILEKKFHIFYHQNPHLFKIAVNDMNDGEEKNRNIYKYV